MPTTTFLPALIIRREGFFNSFSARMVGACLYYNKTISVMDTAVCVIYSTPIGLKDDPATYNFSVRIGFCSAR